MPASSVGANGSREDQQDVGRRAWWQWRRQAWCPTASSPDVLDQIAAVGKVHRLADVHAGRPAGNIAGNTLAAIQDVEPLDARFAVLRGYRLRNDSERRQRGESYFGAWRLLSLSPPCTKVAGRS